MYSHILVPIDGSPISDAAFKEALQLAKEQQAQLRVIHVLDESITERVIGTYAGGPDVMEALLEGGTHLLENARMQAKDFGVDVEMELLEKPGERVAKIILEDANWWPADLIVMGTHGRKGLDRLILGSVAEQVVRQASVPVLLVPGT